MSFVMNRRFGVFLCSPTVYQNSSGGSLIIFYSLYAECTSEPSSSPKLKCKKQFCSAHWPSCPHPWWTEGIPTQLVFSLLLSKTSPLFALSHIGCYQWLHGYTIHPSATCLEFTTRLSIDRNWRTFIGTNLNFSDFSANSDCWCNSI